MRSVNAPINAAIIVAGGRGQRVGNAGGPKQYLDLAGKSVLAHAVAPFLNHENIHQVVVVIHEDDGELYKTALNDHASLLAPVTGGETRQLSVFAGLEHLSKSKINKVLIHDAARPFVDENTISRVLAALDDSSAVLPAIAVSDTIKRADLDGNVEETVSRAGLFAAQTPQGFDFDTIYKLHRKARSELAGRSDFTDDAAIAEWAGIQVQLVEGSTKNRKITTKTDLEEARRYMNGALPDVRTGHGYDTHQLVPGDAVTLCGVLLANTKSLSGHSDADVGLHALTDAVLGTIGAGDIGSHFPPSDPQWKDAQSHQFLRHAVGLVEAKGGTITHCDVTLICEAPKIGPHRDAMRTFVAEIVGFEIDRVSVKATTNERIGFVGREEGIVALATATVVMGSS